MDYDAMAEHMSKLNQALADAAELGKALDMALAERDEAFETIDALHHKLADAETRARLASDLLERMAEDLASEKQLRRVADDAWQAWRERAETAEAALDELRQKLEWWSV